MRFCDRDFDDVHEMNKELTRQWNKIIGPKDIVYFLGDLTMNSNRALDYLRKLNGRIYFVIGNHDRGTVNKLRRHMANYNEHHEALTEVETPMIVKKIGGVDMTLCHYAMRVWNKSHYGAIHCYGHSHGTLPAEGKSLDVGVDNAFRLLGEYRPFTLEEVLHYAKDGQKIANGAIYDYVEHIYKTMRGQLDSSEFEDD